MAWDKNIIIIISHCRTGMKLDEMEWNFGRKGYCNTQGGEEEVFGKNNGDDGWKTGVL
jgi:hypothetical protein